MHIHLFTVILSQISHTRPFKHPFSYFYFHSFFVLFIITAQLSSTIIAYRNRSLDHSHSSTVTLVHSSLFFFYQSSQSHSFSQIHKPGMYMSLENILPITFFPYIGRFIIRRKQAVFYFVHRICSLLIRVTKLVKHMKRKKGLTPEFHIVSLKLSNIFSMTHKRNIPANIHSGMKYPIILLWSFQTARIKPNCIFAVIIQKESAVVLAEDHTSLFRLGRGLVFSG